MDFFCQCGCGSKINICSHHKWYGIPKFIHGHNTIVTPPMKNTETAKKNADIRRGKPILKMRGDKNPSKRFDVRRKISWSKMGERNPNFGKPSPNKGKVGWWALGRPAWNSGLTKETDDRLKIFSNVTSKLWKDSNYVHRQMVSRKVMPNKLEKRLENFLEKLFPNEWKFVGDGQLIIDGRCPDFVNVNGQKKLIELFGNYWHRGENPKDRIKIFKPFGYKTLIVWEKELKDEEKLKDKLKIFSLEKPLVSNGKKHKPYSNLILKGR